MQIKVIYHDDKIDTVDPAILDDLLFSNKIKKFLRSDGWATVGVDSLRSRCPYDGPERRKALGKAAIKKREERLSAIFEKAYSGIALTDASGKIIFANQRMADMFGWTIEELLGTDYLDHLDESEKKVADQNERLVIIGEVDSINTARHYIRKDGSDFWGYIAGRRMQYPDGKYYGLVGVITDITGHKQLEDEQLKIKNLESISILAGGIAHDFNNLLQAIIGNISMAKMYAGPEDKIYARLTDAETAVEQARELSYRLLTFARGGEPVRKVCSMSGLVERTVGLALRGSNISTVFDIPADLCPAEIDLDQMKQVFTNITINAREAMPGGGVLRVRAGNVNVPEGGDEALGLKEGNYIMIAFEDQGIGIQEENLHRIFDPYFTTKKMGAEKGKGMGLAVCRSIIKKHRGTVTCKSKERVGTTIKIYLPAYEKKQGEGALVEKGLAKDTGKILVMDDERNVRRVVGDMLEQFGYEIELAQNGEEALDFYIKALEKGRPFDAVILDLTVINGMGGEAALRKLKEIDPDIKAIVSSGHTDALIMKDFRKYGFINAIAKPYRMSQLHELLSRTLGTDH